MCWCVLVRDRRRQRRRQPRLHPRCLRRLLLRPRRELALVHLPVAIRVYRRRRRLRLLLPQPRIAWR